MHELTSELGAPDAQDHLWSEENARGLVLAALGDWSEAVTAFASAVETAADATNDLDARNALAMLMNNLAQATFRAGRLDEGVAHAEQAYALRVALTGEHSITTARARADLGVMLAGVGREDEGRALLARSLADIERASSDEDPRLAAILENAAQLALTAGEPASAEPLLLRLHALQDEHAQSTTVAESLLRRVASMRSGSHERIVEVPDEPDDAPESDELNLVPIEVTSAFESEPTNEPRHAGILGGLDFDLLDPPSRGPLNATPTAHDAAAPVDDILGFAVEYGTPSEQTPPDPSDIIIAPPASRRIETLPEGAPSILPHLPAVGIAAGLRPESDDGY